MTAIPVNLESSYRLFAFVFFILFIIQDMFCSYGFCVSKARKLVQSMVFHHHLRLFHELKRTLMMISLYECSLFYSVSKNWIQTMAFKHSFSSMAIIRMTIILTQYALLPSFLWFRSISIRAKNTKQRVINILIFLYGVDSSLKRNHHLWNSVNTIQIFRIPKPKIYSFELYLNWRKW